MVVAAGPDADVASALQAVGAARPCEEAGLLVEDGRLQLTASGLCLAEGPAALVVTTATLLAPFLRARALQARRALDPELVATSELFVAFSKHHVVEARLAACLPLPAEDALRPLQAALQAPEVLQQPFHKPVLGNLGLALLSSSDLSLKGAGSEDWRHQSRAIPCRGRHRRHGDGFFFVPTPVFVRIRKPKSSEELSKRVSLLSVACALGAACGRPAASPELRLRPPEAQHVPER